MLEDELKDARSTSDKMKQEKDQVSNALGARFFDSRKIFDSRKTFEEKKLDFLEKASALEAKRNLE